MKLSRLLLTFLFFSYPLVYLDFVKNQEFLIMDLCVLKKSEVIISTAVPKEKNWE